MESQTTYLEIIRYAAEKHQVSGKTIPETNLPYLIHLSNVAMEIFIAAEHTDGFDLKLAINNSSLAISLSTRFNDLCLNSPYFKTVTLFFTLYDSVTVIGYQRLNVENIPIRYSNFKRPNFGS